MAESLGIRWGTRALTKSTPTGGGSPPTEASERSALRSKQARPHPGHKSGSVQPKTGAVNVYVQINLQHAAEYTRDPGKNLLVIYTQIDYIRTAARLVQKLCFFQKYKKETQAEGCTNMSDRELRKA